jgi:hypothetical protein
MAVEDWLVTKHDFITAEGEYPLGFVESVNEYFSDHFHFFGGYPMVFEYEGKVYDFDCCIRHVT